MIAECMTQQFSSKVMQWEYIKYRLRQVSRNASKAKAKEKRARFVSYFFIASFDYDNENNNDSVQAMTADITQDVPISSSIV